jgi:hypothetical protein
MSDPGTMTGKPLIESDRVEGTTVYDPQGNDIGSIKRLMIEKLSGRVAYAVMSFGGFLGMGSEEHTIPWSKLTYDTNLGGYRTDITCFLSRPRLGLERSQSGTRTPRPLSSALLLARLSWKLGANAFRRDRSTPIDARGAATRPDRIYLMKVLRLGPRPW